jgi:hypothetical protein
VCFECLKQLFIEDGSICEYFDEGVSTGRRISDQVRKMGMQGGFATNELNLAASEIGRVPDYNLPIFKRHLPLKLPAWARVGIAM